MPIDLEVTVSGFNEALAHIQKVKDYVDSSPKEVGIAGLNAAGSIFEQNFDAEGVGFGVGGWASLADSTVAKREALGFGGEHPILIRYGDLREITATTLRVAGGSGTFSMTDNGGAQIGVEITAGDFGATARAFGEKSLNQNPTQTAPARPYWFTSATVTRAVRKRAVDTLAAGIQRL
jgi:hypothetical protein